MTECARVFLYVFWYQVLLLIDCMETYSVKCHMDRGTVYDISARRCVSLWCYVISASCCSAAQFNFISSCHLSTTFRT